MMANVTRRSLLGGASVGLALSASGVVKLAHSQGAAAAASGMADMNSLSGLGRGAPRVPFATGAALMEPDVRKSANGELRTNLRVRYAYHDIGGYRLSLRTYEDTIPGPTLRARPGDVLHIRLSNELLPNPDPVLLDMALPHHFNTTNFHAHGLHVDPGASADNVFRSMEPGQAYDIEIAIPANHPSGTFWYHPHHHGSADVQMVSGMAGALIVEGHFAEVPEIAGARERVLILNEVMFDYRGSIESYDTVWPEAVPRFLSVNGQREPAIDMRPGEVQRWRIIHSGHEDNLRLALAGHVFHVIAYDGIALGRMQRMVDLVIAPGQRVDCLVEAGAAGTYPLRAIANDQGYPSPLGALALAVVTGEPLAMRLPGSLPAVPMAHIGEREVTNTRRLTLSTKNPEFPPAANYQEFAYLICGERFDPNRVDQRIPLGAVEEWLVVNEDPDDHIFHIHTNHFEVVGVNGEVMTEPVWRDTVIVPRKGSVTFRSRFQDFTGRFVLHCHMMNHEELGMMQVVEVVAG